MQTVQSNIQLDTDTQNANRTAINKLNESRLKENKKEIKRQLRQLLKEILLAAQESSHTERVVLLRHGLKAIQIYCRSVGKTFIFCELKITCDEYGLGGSQQQSATLFRGPSEDASVAICVTDKGSLLHRNDSCWTVYCDAGDVGNSPDAVPLNAAFSTAPTDLRCLRTPV